jgi:hypothetical protein
VIVTRDRPGLAVSTPTQFSDLNVLLGELVERVAQILGDRLVGAYLQGSFAFGDADLHSDCDFLVPVRTAISVEQESRLREMHAEIPTRTGHWTHYLEGSYPILNELRTLAGLGRPWLYVDHGWCEMQWSMHCNNEVVRWTLRERGVTLAGPDPRTAVDEVPAQALRARMRANIPTFLDDLRGWMSLEIAWVQRYAVTTLCRMLYTLDTAAVASKRQAVQWAIGRLDPNWTDLFEQVLVDRELGFDSAAPPRPGSIEKTIAFAEYARIVARQPE